MIKRIVFFGIALLILTSQTIWGQHLNTFYIGHSLSDGVVDMVNSLSADDPEVGMTFKYQTIPGSPLRWNWQAKERNDYGINLPFYSGFYDEEHGLPAGDFDVLVLTESVPRFLSIIDDTYQYADSFFVYATHHNPDIQIYIYEVWHCIKSGTPTECDYDIDATPWRQRLSDDLPMWESIVDTLNARFNPINPVCLIPAGQGLATLYDSIYANAIPGITSVDQLFLDDIHISDLTKYFVACIHFSMIHGKSPVGLTHQLHNMWGGAYPPLSEAQALKFQEIAWEVVNRYPNSCLRETTSSIDNRDKAIDIQVYPNPANDRLFVKSEKPLNEITIYNTLGKVILTSNANNINIGHLSQGMYILKMDGYTAKFIKQ